MNKNFLCKKRIDFDKINIYNMRIFKNKTQNNKNQRKFDICAKNWFTQWEETEARALHMLKM